SRQTRALAANDPVAPSVPIPAALQGALPPTPNTLPVSPAGRRPRAGTARVRGSFFYRHNDNTFHGAWNSIVRVWGRRSSGGDFILADTIINSDGTFESGDFATAAANRGAYVQYLPINSRVVVNNGAGGDIIGLGPDLGGGTLTDGVHDIGGRTIDGTG